MKKIEDFVGFLIGKISNIFISLFVRFFMYRQYRGFNSAAVVFDQDAKSTPDFN